MRVNGQLTPVPNLPLAEAMYTPSYFNQLNNAMRLFFTKLTAREVGWSDMTSSVSAAGIVGAVAPTARAFGPGSPLRKEYDFAVNDYVYLQPFHVNHDILPGGKAYPHVHWSTNSTSTATVKWELQIQRALGHNQAAFSSPASVYVTQAASGTAWKHMIAEVSDADALTLTEPDELILVTLRRVTNGGTDNPDQVFGLTVDLHYQTDRHATVNKSPNFYG